MDWFGIALQMMAAALGLLLATLILTALLVFLRRA